MMFFSPTDLGDVGLVGSSLCVWCCCDLVASIPYSICFVFVVNRIVSSIMYSPIKVRMPSPLKKFWHMSSGHSPFGVLIALILITSTLWMLEAVVHPQAIKPHLRWA